MGKLIFNWSDQTKYYSIDTGSLLSAADALIPRRIVPQDLENYYKCGIFIARRPIPSYPVSSLIAIPPKTLWKEIDDSLTYVKTLTYSKLRDSSEITRINSVAEKYLSLFKEKKLAVENSGGLDSSLIIEFLNKFGVEPILIGCAITGYEARTERIIQDNYFKKAKVAEVIQQDQTPAFSQLSAVPLHPVPTPSSLFYHRHLVTARLALKNDVSIVLNGSSGDNLLGHSFLHVSSAIPESYHDWCLSDKWVSEMIYNPLNMHYISPFSLPALLRAIVGVRRSQPEDHMKLWARKKFSNMLPVELSKYAYKASHETWVAEGLSMAELEIFDLSKIAFEIVGHKDLKPDLIVQQLKNYFHQKDDEHHKFLMKLSFIVWVASMSRANLITFD